MTITEKLGYVRGLADGLNIESTTPEGKLLLAITDLLSDLTGAMEAMGDIVTSIEEDLDGLYEEIFDLDGEDEDEHEHTIPFPRLHDADEDDEDDAYEFDEDDDTLPSPPCPHCRTPIDITPEILENGSVKCPGCGQKLMLEIREGCGEGCGCGSGCGHHEGDDDDDNGGHGHGGCGCGHNHE